MRNRPIPFSPELNDTALFLGLYGTLIERTATPGNTVAGQRIVRLLQTLKIQLDGAIGIVSGHSIKSIDATLTPFTCAAAGLYGAEHRPTEDYIVRRIPRGFVKLGKTKAFLNQQAERMPGVTFEDRDLVLALHFGDAPEQKKMVANTLKIAADRLGQSYQIIHSRKAYELKPVSANKGESIDSYMSQWPFLTKRPIFIGNDLSDEIGFQVVNKLEGISVRVGDVPKEKTHAQYTLPNVAAVLDWLDACLS